MSARTLRNPIMRQLQRHGRLAAIYRVADAPGPATVSETSALRNAAPAPARAYLWPAADDQLAQPEETGPLPVIPEKPAPAQALPAQAPSVVVQRALAAGLLTPIPQQPAAPQRPAAPSLVQRAASSRPVPRPAEPGQPHTSPAEAIPPAGQPATPPATEPAAEAGEMDPSTWRRLQTIFRRHQAVEDGADEPASEVPSAPAAQDSASAPTIIQRSATPEPGYGSRTAEVEPPASQPAPVQRAPTEPIDNSSAGTDPFLPGWPDSEDEQAASTAAAEELTPGNPAESASTGVENTSAGSQAAPAGPEPPLTPAGDMPVQRLPLEAVWPVEHNSPLAAARSPIVSRPAAPGPLPNSEPDTGQAARLHSTLSQVSPEQATASSIELIPTRRPRPVSLTPIRAPAGSDTGPGQPAAAAQEASLNLPGPASRPAEIGPSQAAPSAPPTQAADQPASSTASPAAGQAPPVAGSASAASPRLVQRKADAEGPSGSPIAETVPAGMISTDIGALPADLWTLIGQPAPTDQAAPRRDPSAAAPGRAEPGPEPISLSANLIQRATEDEGSADVPSDGQPGQSSPPAGQAAGQGQAGQPDIDQLARSVYAEVRRRLNQEWERMRRH